MLPPPEAIKVLRRAGLKKAFVSSSSDDGTQMLLKAAPDLIVPVLRPYRARGETGSWTRDPTIIQHVEARLKANTYAEGMAATVELIDGFRYEIAGSVKFPMPSLITKDLGLDTLPEVEPEVMSTNIGENGEEPMVFYRDPMQLMTHLGEKHGFEAVTGMAELIGWSQGPAKALGRAG